ncbi:MAG: dynamin family protein [Pseudomonadota bacterium]
MERGKMERVESAGAAPEAAGNVASFGTASRASTADAEAAPPDAAPESMPSPGALMSLCFEGLSDFVAERDEVLAHLDSLIEGGDTETAHAAIRHRERLADFAPSVTMIGQVKAGKTSLVNAMLGEPGLLPADVNPWTSVVTALHLTTKPETAPHGARFSFFDEADWERLTRKGGRVGELAGRAGAEDEAEKVRRQIEAMRAKTRRRLGRKFELLLGTSHNFSSYDKELIERYVCLGDDFLSDAVAEGPTADMQGRFADITKAAELWLPRPDWPLSLCLRDTPGVNDTFMMREQITIGALRDSRLCVVVLSAHQALSTVDMALLRLIANVRSREVVIFVNRIDELPEPATQIPEIRAAIRDTLATQPGLEDVEILFGSARWATLALSGRLSEMSDEDADTLLAHAEFALAGPARELGPLELIWWMSGVPSLYGALWQRIVEGAGREKLRRVARSAMNLAVGMRAAAEADPLRAARQAGQDIDTEAMRAELDTLEARMLDDFDAAFDKAYSTAAQRLDRAHKSFLDRATAALVHHLETHGECSPWTYDPAGLRLLLRSSYQVFARQLASAGKVSGESAAAEVAGLYAKALGQPRETFSLAAPEMPRLPPPVLLGQTIALDLKGTWWRRWWNRRRGYASFAPDFHAMIEAETRPIVDALNETHCAPAGEPMRATLREFFADQRMLIAGLGQRRSVTQSAPRVGLLADTVHRLERLAA